MTTVLWLLYFADITTSLSVLSGIFGIGGSLLILLWWGASTIDPMDEIARPPMKLWKMVIPALILSAILPSKTTFYAIAAYRAGDVALQTETGGKALKALNAWLDRQIASSGEAETPKESRP